MTHVRTIKEAAAWFRAEDPHTCLTETAIRRLLRTGKVPCAKVGKKYLVTLEALEEYLSGSGAAEVPILPKSNSIWRVS